MYKTKKNFNESGLNFLMALKLNPSRRQLALEASNMLMYKENYSKLVEVRKSLFDVSKDSMENWCYYILGLYLNKEYQEAVERLHMLKAHLAKTNIDLLNKYS